MDHEQGFDEEYTDDAYNDNDFYAKGVLWTVIGLSLYAGFVAFLKYVVLLF
ncbi:MAG: hypothetical protein ACE5GM_06965 [bacterium]